MYSDKGLGYTDLNNINVSLLCSHLHFHNTFRSTSCLLAVHFWYCRQTPVKDIYRTTFQRAMCHIYIYIYTQSQYIQSVHPAAVAQKIQKYLLPNHQTTDQLLFSILNSFSTQILSLVQHKETTTCILYYIPVL